MSPTAAEIFDGVNVKPLSPTLMTWFTDADVDVGVDEYEWAKYPIQSISTVRIRRDGHIPVAVAVYV